MATTNVTPYDLEAFCTLLRETVTKRGIDGLPDLEAELSRILRDPAFVAATFDEAEPVAKRQLAFEPVTGAYVLAHMHEPGREGAPHTHGDSWAVYGTARGATSMKDWKIVEDGLDGTTLTEQAHYTLAPGDTHSYHSGMIHSTAHDVPTWVVRITGTDLEKVERFRFDRRRDRIV
jgi:hypothetical protein